MVKVAVLTISDSAVAGIRADASGPALKQRCDELSWPVVTSAVVPDEEAIIAERLQDWADRHIASLILTTGGTGMALRDVTPEATRRILEREIPGIAELMRARGLEQTKFSALSRAVAGSRKQSLIVNLPGSPKGAVHSLRVIEDLVPHVIELLAGHTEHAVNVKLKVEPETKGETETS